LKEIQISICGNHTSCLVNLITTILIDTNSSFQTRCNRMLLFDQLDHGKFDQPKKVLRNMLEFELHEYFLFSIGGRHTESLGCLLKI
jgi:hypothetical protein